MYWVHKEEPEKQKMLTEKLCRIAPTWPTLTTTCKYLMSHWSDLHASFVFIFFNLCECCLFFRGILLAEQQRFSEAVQSYENAIQYRPRLAGKIRIIIVSITKLSILIGSPCDYLSSNWCVITWVSNYTCPILTFYNWIPAIGHLRHSHINYVHSNGFSYLDL